MGRINVTSVFLRGGSPNGKLVDSALHRLTQHAHERGVARLGRRALNTQQSAAHSNCSLFGRFRRVRSTIQGQPTHLGNAVQVDACNLDPRVVLLLFFLWRAGARAQALQKSRWEACTLAIRANALCHTSTRTKQSHTAGVSANPRIPSRNNQGQLIGQAPRHIHTQPPATTNFDGTTTTNNWARRFPDALTNDNLTLQMSMENIQNRWPH